MSIEYILWFIIIIYTVVSIISGSNILHLIIFISLIVSIRLIIWLIKNDFFKENSENTK